MAASKVTILPVVVLCFFTQRTSIEGMRGSRPAEYQG